MENDSPPQQPAPGFKGFERDITGQKRTEEELRKSQARFAAVFRSGPVAMSINAVADGRLIDANEQYCEFFGYSREEIIGRSVLDLKTWANPEDRARVVQRLLKDKAIRGLEVKQRRRSGEVRDVLASLELIELADESEPALISMFIDITERKRAEEARLAAEDKFRRLVEHSLVGIYIIQDDRFVYVNPMMAGMFGFSVEELTSAPLLDFVFPEDRRLVGENVRKRLQGEVESVHYTLRGVRKDGTAIYFEAYGSRTEYDGRAAIMGMLLDVSQRKQAEEEIRRLNVELEQRVIERTAQLEAANKELEAFSYSVSHDLRAPLRHIGGFAAMLQRHAVGKLDEKGERFLASISESATRMGKLIDNLLVFSRTGRKEMRKTTVDLEQLAREIAHELQSHAERRNVVWKNSGLPVVNADPAMLRQVFVNLLSNALKYTRARDPAVIEIGREKDDRDEVVIFVRDNGAGFDMKYVNKLFGVFQRLHRDDEFEGTGIGLANVQRIILRHGGRTWAEGKVDEGAVFYFSLPKG